MPPFAPRIALLAAALLMAACAPRGDVTPVAAPPAAAPQARMEVLVGTTRAPGPAGGFHPTARGPLGFAAYDVAIPPAHRPGRLELGGARPDPERHFVSRSATHFDHAGGFRRAVAAGLAARPRAEGEVFLFVHGFNNTLGDGVFRTAQIVADLGIAALPVHYAWPSAGHPLRYVTDRDAVLLARTGLERLLDELSEAGARRIVILAHSMGAQLTMETLRQMALTGRGPAWERLGGVVLMSADIDPDVFRAQAEEIGPLPQPFVLLTSERDPALRLSARLTGKDRRVGNLGRLDDLAALDVTVIDISALNDVGNPHLAAVTSPSLIRLAQGGRLVEESFKADASGRPGLLPGTVLTVQNATAIILDPAAVAAAGR